jgi:hypothetical protein
MTEKKEEEEETRTATVSGKIVRVPNLNVSIRQPGSGRGQTPAKRPELAELTGTMAGRLGSLDDDHHWFRCHRSECVSQLSMAHFLTKMALERLASCLEAAGWEMPASPPPSTEEPGQQQTEGER